MNGSEKCEKSANHGGLNVCTGELPLSEGKTSSDSNGGEDYPKVCQHCGAPATADQPVQLCAVDGQEYLLHRDCQADWLDVSIPPLLRRTGAA